MLFLVWFTLGLFVAAYVMGDKDLAKSGLLCAGLTLLIALLQRISAGCVGCPLCRMRPIVSSGCQKSVKAKALFGSHRNRVALSTLLFHRFRCPYCGEPTRCKVRSRSEVPPSSNHLDLMEIFR
ncbi:MAG: hypothetical protein CFE26_06320 [Verrucomicrobiales bacterium VVV1]|nr:MAG: hypothetical protein CFE26_06320 [Verrucomicrobiales bacterium VVV1]